MNLDVHIDCKTCKERLELVTAPKGHERHLHFRCSCMPSDALICILMKACLAPGEKDASR